MRKGLLTLLLLACSALHAQKIIYTAEDSLFVTRVLAKHAGSKKEKGALLLAIAHEFIGHKYVAGTLEKSVEEPLTVSIHEVDCTTFVEQALALAVTAADNGGSFAQFTENLEKIRYRGGKRNGYASRLHYVSQWIADSSKIGVIEEISYGDYGKKDTLRIDFMSKHAESYKLLKENEALIGEIAKWETAISGREIYYIPKGRLWHKGRELNIKDGDIIVLTTGIDGLDAVHMGIAFIEDEEVRMLHASSAAEKVIKEKRTLFDYQKNRKNQTGARVFRLK